jgi:LacI family transcriptional regulator
LRGRGSTNNDYGQFRLTAVQQPVDAITREALNQLLDTPVTTTLVPLRVSLRVGNTCGC